MESVLLASGVMLTGKMLFSVSMTPVRSRVVSFYILKIFMHGVNRHQVFDETANLQSTEFPLWSAVTYHGTPSSGLFQWGVLRSYDYQKGPPH